MSRRPRLLLTGATGQLGKQLRCRFLDAYDVIACDRVEFDLTHVAQMRAKVRDLEPDVILNAGAYTAVDRAESERDDAMKINAVAPGVLAEEATRCGALLVHYSTDYVFDGTKTTSWIETDTPNPLNVYGESKLAGERKVEDVGGRFLVFRTSWVYGPDGRNFLNTMLRLGRQHDRLTVVDDQVGAPTSTLELAQATRTIVDGIFNDEFGTSSDWSGVYHMTCAGAVSWFEFARAIFAEAESVMHILPPQVLPVSTSAYPTSARRPKNSILSNEKLVSHFGIGLVQWRSALAHVLQLNSSSISSSAESR